MKSSLLHTLIALLAALTFNSCSKDIFNPNDYRGPDEVKDNYLVLRDETKMLTVAEKSEIISVKGNEMTIRSGSELSQSVRVGSVLVNNGADSGDSIAYYKKVISLNNSGNEIQLLTENASLRDAYFSWSIDSRSDVFTIKSRDDSWTDHFSFESGLGDFTFGGTLDPNFNITMAYDDYYFTSAFDSLAVVQAQQNNSYIDPSFHLHFENLRLTISGSFHLTKSFELNNTLNLPAVMITPIAQTGLGLYLEPNISLSGKAAGSIQSPLYEKTFGGYDLDLSYTIGDLAPVFTSTLNQARSNDSNTEWMISGSAECELQMGGELFVSVIGGQNLAKAGLSLFNFFTPTINHKGDFTTLAPGYDLGLDVGIGTNFFIDFSIIDKVLGANWSTDDYKYKALELTKFGASCPAYSGVDLDYNEALQSFEINVRSENVARINYNIFVNDEQITNLGDPDFTYNTDYTLNLPLFSDPVNKIRVADVTTIGCYLEDKFIESSLLGNCDDMVTDDEGNSYCTLEIGQLRWMTENLRTSTAGSAYSGEKNNETRLYGRLYTFDEIMNGYAYSPSTSNEKIQGICPNGWHLPTVAEWNDLAQALGGYSIAGKNMKLASQTLWPNAAIPSTGTFNAVPAGEHYLWKSGSSAFGNRGNLTKFWSTKIGAQGEVTIIEVGPSSKIQEVTASSADPVFFHSIKDIGYSCRCVED